MSVPNDADRELEQVEEVLAMADRIIHISRQEQERLSSTLTAVPEQAVEQNSAQEQLVPKLQV